MTAHAFYFPSLPIPALTAETPSILLSHGPRAAPTPKTRVVVSGVPPTEDQV